MHLGSLHRCRANSFCRFHRWFPGRFVIFGLPMGASEPKNGNEVVVMVSLLNAISIASVLTASATLRFRLWKRPLTLFLYFISFLVGESVMHHYFLPDVAMGIEVAVVCFGLTGALGLACFAMHILEKRAGSE